MFSDVVFRIQHRDPPCKCLVVHFNHLKPYLLCSRDAQEGTEQLSKQKDDEQDPSFTDKEVRESASPDSDTEEGEVIIEEEHQDELDDELEDQEADGDEDERPGEPPEVEPQAPLQAEQGDGEPQAPQQAEHGDGEPQAPLQAEQGDGEPQAPLQAELGAGDQEEVLGNPVVLKGQPGFGDLRID